MITDELLMELTAEHGSPLYVYDADLMLARYRELQECVPWPKLRILYAMKANYNPGLLSVMEAAGAHLDTVSPGDVILAKRLGFTPDRLLYTANNLTEAEMAEIRAQGVLFNIGSLSRLEKFGRAFPGSDVCIRFNPDVVAGAHAKIKTGGDLTKFGVLMQDADEVVAIAKQYDLRIVGVHEHTGSGIEKTDQVYQSMRNLLGIVTRERFPDLEFVDFGGGFKVPYRPDEERIDYRTFGKGMAEIFAEFCEAYGKELWMYFEPGKFIVAECGTMVVEVNTLKDNRGRRIAGTNSGFPQLIRPMFYEAYHQIRNLSNADGEALAYDVCGNICETGDTFATDRQIAEIREGDLLAIENAGAYCYAMGGVYNLRAMPAEVVVHKGEAKLARRRLSSEELIDQILGESS